MKRRYLYVLLFGVPALLVSFLFALFVFAATAGLFWIFVFGDSPWPPGAETTLLTVLIIAFFTPLIAFVSAAFVVGKNQEQYASLNVNHVIGAVGITAFAGLIVVLHQVQDYIASNSEEALCGRFCQAKGFNSSGTPPRDAGARTCSCFDRSREAVKVPMEDITPGGRQVR